MATTIRIPGLDRLPLPSLSPTQWTVVGGAVLLGVTEILSPPIALAVGVAPLVDRYLLNGGSDAGSASRASGGRRRTRSASGGSTSAAAPANGRRTRSRKTASAARGGSRSATAGRGRRRGTRAATSTADTQA